MALNAVPLAELGAADTSSTLKLVKEALEQCQAEMTQPTVTFDTLSRTKEQQWLMSKASDVLQTLSRQESLRGWPWRIVVGSDRASNEGYPWFSASIIALNEEGKMKADPAH